MEKFVVSLFSVLSVITDGGKTVWVAGQTASRDNEGKDISNQFEAQTKQLMLLVIHTSKPHPM